MLITQVFPHVGMKLSIADTYANLQSVVVNKNKKYKKQIAAGSIGGAVNSGFIVLLKNRMYMRTR